MTKLAVLRSQLKAVDRDRYLASLLMPEALQTDIMALYLFNGDVAAIRDRINEPMAGEIRLQWWHEVITGSRQEEAIGHPFAPELLSAITRHQLPVSAFERLLTSREFDLYDDPMPDQEAYETYAGSTASAMIQLSAMVLDAANSAAYTQAAGHAGVAHSIAGHLMLLVTHIARGQVYLPGDLIAAIGLDRDSFLAGGDNTDRRKAIVSAFVAYGREHLSKARQALDQAPKTGRAAFIPAAIAEGVFAKAEKLGGACFERSPQPSMLARQWAIWRSATSGRI